MAQKRYKITEIYEDVRVYYVLASSKKDAQKKVKYHREDFLALNESSIRRLPTKIEEVENKNEN